MDVKNFVGLLVFGVIGIIVLSAFVPIISDTTSSEKTFTNEGLYYMTYVPENESHELVFTPGSGWTFDGEPFNEVGLDYTILGTDDLVIRGDGRARGIYSSTGTQAIDLTITNTTLTGTFGVNVVDLTYQKIIIATPNKTTLIMKDATTVATVKSNSEIEGYGYTEINTDENVINRAVIHIDGTIADDFTITVHPTGADSLNYRIENITTDATAINSVIDTYTFTKIQFDVIVTNESDVDYTTHCTYNRIVVPSSVTAEKSVHPDSALSAVIDLLPLIAGIGLLIILVAEFLYSRYF